MLYLRSTAFSVKQYLDFEVLVTAADTDSNIFSLKCGAHDYLVWTKRLRISRTLPNDNRTLDTHF